MPSGPLRNRTAVVSPKPISKFAIVTTQRSGSTWLIDLLDSHPEIRAYGEIFLARPPSAKASNNPRHSLERFYEFQRGHNGIRPWVTLKYLDLLDFRGEGRTAVGFKLMYDQCLVRPEILLKMVRERYRIIHLRRENVLDVVLSLNRMRETNVAHLRSDSGQTAQSSQPASVDPRRLLGDLSYQSRQQRAARVVLKLSRLLVLDVTYEALRHDPVHAMSAIARHLSVSTDHSWRSSLKKLSKESHRAAIANYAEVEAALSKTRFKAMLRA